MIERKHPEGSDHLVLVADDDPQIRSYIKTVFQGAEFQVVEAGDGLEALKVFHTCRDRIDLVITDIRMPHLKGTDLAIALRSYCPTIPVIFMSGEAPALDRHPKDGFVFIEKPFGPKVLLDAVRGLLQVRSLAY